jgi:hypothetical protein
MHVACFEVGAALIFVGHKFETKVRLLKVEAIEWGPTLGRTHIVLYSK